MGGNFQSEIWTSTFFFNLKTAIESSIFSVGLRKLLHHTKYYYNISMLPLFVMSIQSHLTLNPEPVLYTFILPFFYEIHILNQYWTLKL